jgi:inorganic pyrophosphatase
MTQPTFPAATSFLGKVVTAQIDRPVHSKHPKWSFTYPVNYGYLPGVLAPDGEYLDVYVLQVDMPLVQFQGKCVAVLHRLDDEDDKLILVPKGQTV